jgi:hypothetical protein
MNLGVLTAGTYKIFTLASFLESEELYSLSCRLGAAILMRFWKRGGGEVEVGERIKMSSRESSADRIITYMYIKSKTYQAHP